MPSRFRPVILLLAIIVLSLLLNSTQLEPVRAQAAGQHRSAGLEPIRQGSWVWQNPWPQGNALNAAWGYAPDSYWVAGRGGTILFRNGSTWTLQETGIASAINDIWGASAGDAWAVGESGVILHWNGLEWRQQDTGTSTTLNAVWGLDSTNVWAAGNGGTILKWDGDNWSRQNSSTNYDLTAVWGTAPDDVWAAGLSGTVRRWDGQQWAVADPGSSAQFYGIHGTAHKVWVVGSGGTILEWDGIAWQSRTSGGTSPLYDVWVSDDATVWVGGFEFLAAWRSGGWTAVPDSRSNTTIRGLWGATAGSIIAVGDYGRVLHWNGNTWNALSSAVTPAFTDIWGKDGSSVWAVGSGGATLRWNGSAWQRQAPGHDGSRAHIWGSDANHVWIAAGNDIAYWNGSSWRVARDLGNEIGAIWGAGTGSVWAAGLYGHVYRWENDVWRKVFEAPAECGELEKIWGVDADNLWIPCHESGTLLHWNGNAWQLQSTGTSLGFIDVWGAAANDVWAAGFEGIEHWNGTEWSVYGSPAGVAGPYTRIWGIDSSHVWSIGPRGTLLYWDGSAWAVKVSEPSVEFDDIWGYDAGHIWAVGHTRQADPDDERGVMFVWDGISWKRDATIAVRLQRIWGLDKDNIWALGEGGAILGRQSGSVAELQAANDAGIAGHNETVSLVVVANDTNPLGTGLMIASVTQPADGTARVSNDGQRLIYTPAPGYSGVDQFTYTLEDAAGRRDEAAVTVFVAERDQVLPQAALLNGESGETGTFDTECAHMSVLAPAGFLGGTTGATDTLVLLFSPLAHVTEQRSQPPANLVFANLEFNLDAYHNRHHLPGMQLARPLTVEIRYDADMLGGQLPETASLWSWNGSAWSSEGIAPLARSVQSDTYSLRAELNHLGRFAVFAAEGPPAVPDGPVFQPDAGGTQTEQISSLALSITVLPETYTDPFRIDVQAACGTPPTGKLVALGRSFIVEAEDLAAVPIARLARPMTLVVRYLDEDVTEIDELSLGVFWWDEMQKTWVVLPTTVDTSANTLTTSIDRPATFAVLRPRELHSFLPQVRR